MESLHIAICAALFLAAAANAIGIKRRMGDTRIVVGNAGYIENMPYMVSLQDSGNYFCGGSILNACHVLTSAKCVVGKDPEALTIRGGSPYFNESGNEYAARKIVIHPKFSGDGLDYNVAIIQIRAPMAFGETIQPIPLAGREPEPGMPLTIAGWGELEEGGEIQHRIHFAVVQVADKGKCARVYDSVFDVTDRTICTYVRGRGACHGDSGGPAVYNNRVVGVISHRVGCGMLPDIHTNMANPDIREFILANARRECK